MGQEGVDLGLGHLGGMAYVVKVDEPFDPVAICALGTTTVMARSEGQANLVHKLRFMPVDGPPLVARRRCLG